MPFIDLSLRGIQLLNLKWYFWVSQLQFCYKWSANDAWGTQVNRGHPRKGWVIECFLFGDQLSDLTVALGSHTFGLHPRGTVWSSAWEVAEL